MFDVNIVAEVIKKIRIEKKLSQEVISGLANLDRTHYSKIERALRCPTLETIFKIAYALDIKPHDLVRQIEEKMNEQA